MKAVYIVGLGNPGVKYSETRHNVGKILVKRFAALKNLTLKKQGTNSIGAFEIDDIRIVLAYPDVYMNHSGKAVKNLLDGNHEAVDRLLVLIDDLETKLGSCKLVHAGGSRGHNGLRSIHKELGTKNFFQLRIGIGRPESEHDDVADFVLSSFTKDEKEVIDSLCDEVFRLLSEWIESKRPPKQ